MAGMTHPFPRIYQSWPRDNDKAIPLNVNQVFVGLSMTLQHICTFYHFLNTVLELSFSFRQFFHFKYGTKVAPVSQSINHSQNLEGLEGSRPLKILLAKGFICLSFRHHNFHSGAFIYSSKSMQDPFSLFMTHILCIP